MTNSIKLSLKNTFTYKFFSSLLIQGLEWIEIVGYIGLNFYNSLKYIFKLDINYKSTLEQCSKFGFDSLPLTLAIGGLTGMIIALQVAYEMVKQGAGDYVGALVTIAVVRELGPIMGSFAVISMVGSSMTAEVATMKVTEQIDAMKTLKIDPIQYLIVPRILAGFLMMPFVVVLTNFVGILGGMLSSNFGTGLNILTYMESAWRGLSIHDIKVTLLKGFVFGGVIALIGTSIGYETEGGAVNVGRATTKAVVWSFIAVVFLDYIISMMFY